MLVVGFVFCVFLGARAQCVSGLGDDDVWCGKDGSRGVCVSGRCVCEFGFAGRGCSFPVISPSDPRWLAVDIVLGILVPTLVFCLAMLELVFFVNQHRSKWNRKKVFPLLALVFLGAAAFVRTFYYSIDPFAWRGTVPPCVLFSIDYLSTSFLAIAYLMVLLSWSTVMLKFEELSGKRKPLMFLWTHLPKLCLLFALVQFLVLVPSCATSCVCDGNNCAEKTSDLVFYISWLVTQGIAVVLAMCAVIGMLVHLIRLRNSTLVSSNQAERVGRITRYSLFVLFSCLSALLMLIQGGVLLARDPTSGLTPARFLAAETLLAFAIDLQMIAVLLVSYTAVRKPQPAHGAQDKKPAGFSVQLSNPLVTDADNDRFK